MLGYGVIDPIRMYSGVNYSPVVSIGNDVYIGSHVKIDCADRVEIGDGCVLSDFVHITDLSHGFEPSAGFILNQNIVPLGSVKLGGNCFVGLGSSISPGVHLGEWCIVGARSVVTQSFPAFSMVAGSPARLIKRYSTEEKKWTLV
jgi:acetyltransferase-like isoleucine patch superfamily enzyme